MINQRKLTGASWTYNKNFCIVIKLNDILYKLKKYLLKWKKKFCKIFLFLDCPTYPRLYCF